MRFAYADPPYLGCAVRLYGDHPDAAVYDTTEGHRLLIERLVDEFPDGWAYSLTSNTLHDLLPLCPSDVRVMAWVKGWCSWKPGANPAYAWEPVLMRGGRSADAPWKTRDWVQCNVATAQTGGTIAGQKPWNFSRWLFTALGAIPGDELVDMFPGSGAVAQAWERFTDQPAFDVSEISDEAML